MTAVTRSTQFLMRMICVTASCILFFVLIASIQTAYAAYDARANAFSLGQIGEKGGIVPASLHSVDRYISRISLPHGQILPITVMKRGSAGHGFSRGGHGALRMIVGWLFLPIFFGFEHPLVFCFALFCLSVLFIVVEEYRNDHAERGVMLARQRHS